MQQPVFAAEVLKNHEKSMLASEATSILIIEEESSDRMLLYNMLLSLGFSATQIAQTSTPKALASTLINKTIDVILLSVKPGDASKAWLKQFIDDADAIPVIILSPEITLSAIQLYIQLGAQDYICNSRLSEYAIAKAILVCMSKTGQQESLQPLLQWDSFYNSTAYLPAVYNRPKVVDVSKAKPQKNNNGNKNLEGTIRIGINGMAISICPAAEAMLEITEREYVEIDPFSLIHPGYQKPLSDALLKIIKEKDAAIDVEFLHKLPDGNYCWLSANLQNKLCGAAEAIVIKIKDISQEKETAENLKQFSHIIKETYNGVIITDTNGYITWVNEAFTNLSGYQLHEARGKKPGWFLQGPGTSKIAKRYMAIKIANRRPFECDLLNYTKLGRKYWIRIQCQPQYNENGNFCGYFAMQSDISLVKEAEEKIRNSEEKYRNLFDFNPASIIIWDAETFQVLEVNNMAVEMYGYSKEEFTKLTVMHIREAADYDKIKAFAEALKNNSCMSFKGVWNHINCKGEKMVMNISTHLMRYNNRQAVLAIANNITEKVKLEEALEVERTKKHFEITNAAICAQEKERTEIGGELHDNVNQILAGSLLYIGLLKKEHGEKMPLLLEADKLINAAIFEIRQLSHSMIPPQLTEIPLVESLEDVVKIAVDKGISIHKHYEAVCDKKISVKLKLTIYRIIQEQFNNILKHSKATNVYLDIIAVNDNLELSIKDDGIGFDLNKKNKGIGLTNIQTRASLFEGKVKICIAPGKGCALKVLFTNYTKQVL